MSVREGRPGWSVDEVRMLSFCVTLITILSTLNQVQTDIVCSDCCPKAGAAFNLTCIGEMDGSCDWSLDGTSVLQCFTGSGCFSTGPSGYTGYRLSDKQYVLQIDSLDKATHNGMFECKQGTDRFKFPMVVVTAKPSNDVSGTCQDKTVKCTLTAHGDPAVALELMEGSTVVKSTSTDGRVSHAGVDGKTYTCKLNETTCVTNAGKDVTCEGTSGGLGPGAIAGIAIGGVVVVAVVGVGLGVMKKNKMGLFK